MTFEKLMWFFENTRLGKWSFVLLIIIVVFTMLMIASVVFIWDHLVKELLKDCLTDEVPLP